MDPYKGGKIIKKSKEMINPQSQESGYLGGKGWMM